MWSFDSDEIRVMTTRLTSLRLAPLLAACLLAPASTSCSLGTFDRTECSTSAHCRESFGFGYTCAQEGYCEKVVVAPRCTKTYPEDLFTNPTKYADTVVFGNLMDRSSPKKAARENAARLAVLQSWDEPALEGRRFGMVFCTVEENLSYDDRPLEQAAVESARWLARELGVPAIVGPSGSSATAAVYQALVGTNTLVISPAATSVTLTSLDTTNATDDAPGLLWRTAPSDATQGPAIAQDMVARGIAHVAVVHQTDEYGQGLANIFNDTFGGQIDLYPFSNDSQRAEAITTAAGTAAEEVLFVASNSDEIVAFLNGAAANSGYDGKSFFLTDAAASRDVFLAAMNAQALFPRIRGTRVKPLDGRYAYETFVASYSGEYGGNVKELSFTAQSYDAAWLVMYGSAWSLYRTGSVTGRGIAQGLRKVSCTSDGVTAPCNPGPEGPFQVISSSWGPIVESFRNGTAVELEGASGDLNFDLATEETSADIEVWIVQSNGEVLPAP